MQRFIFEREQLGTIFRIVVIANLQSEVENLVEKAFEEVDRIEKTYSRFLQDNELFEFNCRLGEWVQVSAEFFELVEFGKKLKRQTAGAFDLTVKSLLTAFGYDEKYSFVENGEGSLGEVEMKNGNLVKLSAPIDLGALGKGYAVDRVAGILQDIENFCINAGGDIYAQGSDLQQSGWKILFEDPSDIKQAIGFKFAQDLALASSNSLRRKWGDKNHLIDARKSKCAEDMLSVYTQAQSCLLADAYSTALFVMGFDEAKKLVEKLPIQAMLISKKGEIFKTADFQGELFAG